MQTGVPLWVPLVIAFVGLIGVLAGQAISAWREDRRWLRDRERDVEKLEHESRLEWRLQRFEVYRAFVASVDEFMRSMPAMNPFSCTYSLEYANENSEYRQRTTDCLTAVEESVIAVEFLASKHLGDAADDLVRSCEEARYSMYPPPVAPRPKDSQEHDEVDWKAVGEKHKSAREKLERSRSEFMSKAKRELALVTSRDDVKDDI